MRNRAETAEYILLKKAFEDGEEFTVHSATKFLGLSTRNTREYLNLLHSQKLITIVGYDKTNRGPALPIYAIQTGGDVPYPPRFLRRDLKRIERSRKLCRLLM